jgi:hypothetical protein
MSGVMAAADLEGWKFIGQFRGQIELLRFTSPIYSCPTTFNRLWLQVTPLGSQKDTARELGAKLASLNSVVWIDILLFLFGLATLFYPPLRAIIGSVTTSMAITGGGIALITLPSIVVGNELIILAGVAAIVITWFLVHGTARGLLQATHQTRPFQDQKLNRKSV